jgi:predicted acyl esterase
MERKCTPTYSVLLEVANIPSFLAGHPMGVNLVVNGKSFPCIHVSVCVPVLMFLYWLRLDDDRSGNRFNVPLNAVSELQRFEGADPAYWVAQGYIVLSPEPRGVGKSEGNIRYWGRQLAEDGYDFIEWAAVQPWSNGKVAMTGNSFLAVSQWFIAAEQPPHLTCIAPWEGFSDHFIDAGNGGGIPGYTFADIILKTFSGQNLVEDQPKMISNETFRTPYWLDKQARLDQIKVPAYIVASYTNAAHTRGTFWAWRKIGSAQKWLRVHDTQEWIDYYSPAAVADLTKYFDYYLKGIQNDWMSTPKVRLSVLDLGHTDIVNRTENEFPLARTKYTPLFLDPTPTSNLSNFSLSFTAPQTSASLSYPVTGSNQITFSYTFQNDTELTGYMALRLWVEARGSNDMELSFSVDKLNADGVPYPMNGQISFSATGLMRVSRRQLDPQKSTFFEPLQLNLNQSYLEPGEIVPIDVNIWPMGMIYHAGETMRLKIGEQNTDTPEFDFMGFGIGVIEVPANGGTYVPGTNVSKTTLGVPAGQSTALPSYIEAQSVPPTPSRNNGTHVFYAGGKYDSRLLIPII